MHLDLYFKWQMQMECGEFLFFYQPIFLILNFELLWCRVMKNWYNFFLHQKHDYDISWSSTFGNIKLLWYAYFKYLWQMSKSSMIRPSVRWINNIKRDVVFGLLRFKFALFAHLRHFSLLMEILFYIF